MIKIGNTSRLKSNRSYNVQIWVGRRPRYNCGIINESIIRDICNKFVNEEKDCITITSTEFLYVNGSEPGVIIGYIQYPRFFRKRKEIRRRAFKLAEILMKELNQNRVTITTPYKSYMLENETGTNK